MNKNEFRKLTEAIAHLYSDREDSFTDGMNVLLALRNSELKRRRTKRAADECPGSSDGKHEFYQGSTWRICAHCGTRR